MQRPITETVIVVVQLQKNIPKFDFSKKAIHAISLILHKGRNIEGLRFYDRDMELIIDQLWDDKIDGMRR